MNETQLENLCLDWFAENGWEVVHGIDIAPDSSNPLRKDYKQILIEADLQTAFERLNPHLPASCFEQVLQKLNQPESLDLVTNNRAFHRMLLEGVPVTYKKQDDWVHDHAFLVDFNHVHQNRFVAVNQFTILGTKQPRRPDIICFINGIPFAVLELKSPTDENADIWDAFNQLQTYKEEISDLFVFNEALVVSDGVTARVGSLTANQERFLPWRTIKNEDDKPVLEWELETVIRGFFDRELFLDYIRFFVLFETDGEKTIKKIAGYHQFHAVREAVHATIAAANPNGDKKAGVVWHTQGSGKSISMCCYAGKLLQQPAMHNPTLLIVTDRNDLDGQLFETFSNAQELLKQTPVQANNRDELRKFLAERESGGIIFTTVQKFALLEGESEHPLLNGRHNIVVMSDEAHRSQYGLKAKLGNDGTYKFGYAKHMRDALKNAAFIGFTGTPISSEDKDTRAVFGDYVSIYDIQDAVDDGATVPIYYESRLAKLSLNNEELPHIDDEVDELAEDEEESEQAKLKSRWAALEKVVGSKPRIERVAADLVAHFEERNQAQHGKAMMVAMSREICVHLYDAVVALRPDWHDPDPDKGAIKIVMTGSASDKALLRPHIHATQVKKRLEKRFKDPSDPLKLVIVRDMWLTGFDAPCVHTLYVDKPMKGHNLMQAIARVNRVFKDKQGGLVVDYIGIANELKSAIKEYTASKGRGKPTVDAHEAYAVLEEKLDILRALLHGFDYSDYLTGGHKLLAGAANFILGLEDGKKRFADNALAMSKAFTLCCTLDEAKAVREEVAFLQAVKVMLTKKDVTRKKKTDEERDLAIRQIIGNAVVSGDVVDVFEAVGLDKPNIGLLDDEFLAEVRNLPERNLAVELLERLLEGEIKSKFATNLSQEKKFSEMLTKVIARYQNRSIETAQVIEELIDMAKKFAAVSKRGQALGLNDDELAFYDALANNEASVRELGDEILAKIAHELTANLRRSVTVDWSSRESVRAKLRLMVKRILRKYKYPPDQQEEAAQLVLAQAESLCEVWC